MTNTDIPWACLFLDQFTPPLPSALTLPHFSSPTPFLFPLLPCLLPGTIFPLMTTTPGPPTHHSMIICKHYLYPSFPPSVPSLFTSLPPFTLLNLPPFLSHSLPPSLHLHLHPFLPLTLPPTLNLSPSPPPFLLQPHRKTLACHTKPQCQHRLHD